MATNGKHEPGQHSYPLALPAGVALPSGLPEDLEALESAIPEDSPTAIPIEYPRLYRRLRYLGLPFQSAYSRRVSARIIGRSVRTLREWTRQGKIACYRCNGIATTPSPYHTARSIENYLSAFERGKA
jgi:hypothetical protein